MEVKRGDLVAVAIQGDYGKPRPALIIQSELFSELASFTIQFMIDKAPTVAREKIGKPFGCLGDETMLAVNRALAVFLGFA